MAASTATSVAQARAWPGKPLKVVVAFAPGGAADIAARVVAQALQEGLGQQFLVENKGSAGGNGATRLVAKEPADGPPCC